MKRDGTGRVEMKIKIPNSRRRALGSIKILTGKTMSKALSEALDAYFDEIEAAWESGVPLNDHLERIVNEHSSRASRPGTITLGPRAGSEAPPSA